MLILDVHGYGQWDLYLYLPVGLSSHADVRSTLNPPPSAPCPLLSALGITLPPPSVRTSFVDDPLVARERNMVRMKMRMMGGINQAAAGGANAPAYWAPASLIRPTPKKTPVA